MILCSSSWDIGVWSECSKTCGLGMQHRQILCRQFYINRTLTVPAKRCEHLERPESSSTCQLKICSEWQIRSEWTSVSDSCPSHHSLHSGVHGIMGCQFKNKKTNWVPKSYSVKQCRMVLQCIPLSESVFLGFIIIMLLMFSLMLCVHLV